MDAIATSILNQIKNKSLKNMYFLHGDESYYIDLIEKKFNSSLLTDDEKEFDFELFYGKDAELSNIIGSARQFPMIGQYRLVIVREAQHLKDFKGLISFIENPPSNSILVFCYKGKKFDARNEKKLSNENTQFFFSKKLYDNQIPQWVEGLVKSEGYRINAKNAVIISEFLGNDLTKITNELKKIYISIPKGEEITDEIIEKNIGLSKDFNVFEFGNAIAKRDIPKANLIVNYFANNQKNHPFVVSCNQLYRYFSNLLLLHMNLKSTNPREIASILRINQFFTKEYEIGLKIYNRKKVAQNIHLIAEFDLKSKGLNNVSTDEGELLKELTYKIMH